MFASTVPPKSVKNVILFAKQDTRWKLGPGVCDAKRVCDAKGVLGVHI